MHSKYLLPSKINRKLSSILSKSIFYFQESTTDHSSMLNARAVMVMVQTRNLLESGMQETGRNLG